MKCPVCGKKCVQSAEDVLLDVDRRYMACRDCPPEPHLDKNKPFRDLPHLLERCSTCGKGSLDVIMLNAMQILIKFGLRDERETLRSIGSPLIAVGYPLAYPPRLGKQSLVLIGDRLSKDAAEAIVKHIPEIKGVILSKGTPGVHDIKAAPVQNELLAGCDLRADVVQSLFGELVIYKSQSKIHIEFPRHSAPKMKILEQLYLRGKIRNVTDGLCGPGTLGMMCVLAGAKHVVFNDAWLPSVQNCILNLEINKKLLGIEEIEYLEPMDMLEESVGLNPVLACRAHGLCDIEVYHGDLARLFSKARPTELCLIDHFPGEKTLDLEKACCCCKEIVII